MLYKGINKLVFEHFSYNSQGSDTFIMSFDNNDLEKISKKLEISKEEIINVIAAVGKDNWEAFITEGEIIPLCYGLIALQILCASSMEFGRYNEILEEKLKRPEHQLQNLYRLYQDKLWTVARLHIESIGYACNFPESSTGPGRFIQYPKSQSYLNRRDLETLSLLFLEKELKPYFDINLFDFIEILEIENSKKIPTDFITNHAKKVFSHQEFKQNIFQKQIYNFYLTWNGGCKEQISSTKKASNRKLYFDDKKRFFTFDNKQEYIIGFETGFKRSLLDFNIIKKTNEIIVLKRDPSWGDFEEVKKVQLGDDVMFVILNTASTTYNFLLKTEASKFKITSENVFVFQFKVARDHLKGIEYFISTKNNSIEWIGGVKLERNIYLKGCGPQYKALEKCTVLINGEVTKLDKDEILDLRSLQNGEHTIQPMNARKINFLISESKYESTFNNNLSGWNLNSLRHSDSDWNISGLFLKTSKNIITVRNFIDLSLGKIKRVSEKNQVLKILSKQKIKKW